MHIAKDPTKTPIPAEPVWATTQVAVELDAGQYLLDDGRLAIQATSCVIRPMIGDRVLIASCKEGENYIVHLLNRTRDNDACLNVPGMERLAIQQAHIDLQAS